MDINRILDELRAELEAIDNSIAALESLAVDKGGKKRGRPPGWLVDARKRKAQEPKATS